MNEKNKKNISPARLTSELKDFKKISIFICVIGDLLLCYYIWSLFSDFSHFKVQVNHSLDILKSIPEFSRGNLPSNFHSQIHGMVMNSLKLILAGFIVIHSLIYTFFYLEKNFALKYIRMMIWPAAVSSFLIGFAEMKNFNFTYLFFLIGVLYIYAALHLKKIRNDESGFIW